MKSVATKGNWKLPPLLLPFVVSLAADRALNPPERGKKKVLRPRCHVEREGGGGWVIVEQGQLMLRNSWDEGVDRAHIPPNDL